MAKKVKYIKGPGAIPLIKQKIALQVAYPTSSSSIDDGVLWWCGKVRPTALSREYKVLLTYGGNQPTTWVIGDELKQLDHVDFPHNYEVDQNSKMAKICLYLPGANEWSNRKYLSNTIIPWAIEWLYHYEIWTGEWCGGGQHPNSRVDKEMI